MNRSNLFINTASLAESTRRYPVRLALAAGPADPELQPFIPGSFQGALGDRFTIWVDFDNGDDGTAMTASSNGIYWQNTAVFPFKTFAGAWAAAMSVANGNANSRYVIRLKNVLPESYLFPSGAPPITVTPNYPNVAVRGEGISITQFQQPDDYLTFTIQNVDNPVYLDFGDMTLQHLYVKVKDAEPGAGASALSLINGLTVQGNGTTGINNTLAIHGSNGGSGTPDVSGSTAENGTGGGLLTNVIVDGFVAVNAGASVLIIAGGDGGQGGAAEVYMSGEYNDQETYGAPGNGASPGIATDITIKNMTARPVIESTRIPYPNAWDMVVQQGSPGLGGIYVGGGQDGTVAGGAGSLVDYNAVNQKVLILHSDVLALNTSSPTSPGGGTYKAVLCMCLIGFVDGGERILVAYDLETVGGVMHPATTITAFASNTTNTPQSTLLLNS